MHPVKSIRSMIALTGEIMKAKRQLISTDTEIARYELVQNKSWSFLKIDSLELQSSQGAQSDFDPQNF